MALSVPLAFISGASAQEGPEWTERIGVEVEGEGADRVFIPGLTSSPKVFTKTTRDLGGELHMVTVQGFAGTEAPDDLSEFIGPVAKAMADYLETEGIEDASLIGHSMGGIVAMLAAEQSDRVGRVLIVDSVPFLPGLFTPGVTGEQAALMRPVLRQQMKRMTKETWMQTVRQGLPRQAVSDEAREAILKVSEESDFEAAKAAFVELMTTDYSEVFAKVEVPVTVLVPFDPSIGFSRAAVLSRYQDQYRDVPNVELRVIENSRHFVMMDQPEAFRTELERFLSKED